MGVDDLFAVLSPMFNVLLCLLEAFSHCGFAPFCPALSLFWSVGAFHVGAFHSGRFVGPIEAVTQDGSPFFGTIESFLGTHEEQFTLLQDQFVEIAHAITEVSRKWMEWNDVAACWSAPVICAPSPALATSPQPQGWCPCPTTPVGAQATFTVQSVTAVRCDTCSIYQHKPA